MILQQCLTASASTVNLGRARAGEEVATRSTFMDSLLNLEEADCTS